MTGDHRPKGKGLPDKSLIGKPVVRNYYGTQLRQLKHLNNGSMSRPFEILEHGGDER